MSIQKILNEQLFSYLPTVKNLIDHSHSWESNQMYQTAIRAALDSSVPVSQMNINEIDAFEKELIRVFKYRRLLNQNDF